MAAFSIIGIVAVKIVNLVATGNTRAEISKKVLKI